MNGTAHHVLTWDKPQSAGGEEAHLELGADQLQARGIAVHEVPIAYRLDYALETGPGFVTTRLAVSARGDDWARRVELRTVEGEWIIDASTEGSAVDLPPPGGAEGPLVGALDTDLGLSPMFNSMPVLRHGLHEGPGRVEFLMAWVSVPDLAVGPLHERYTHLGIEGERRTVRYESLAGPGGEVLFTEDLVYDADGVVTDYPDLATLQC
jgi:uncharacterized protein